MSDIRRRLRRAARFRAAWDAFPTAEYLAEHPLPEGHITREEAQAMRDRAIAERERLEREGKP